MWVTRRKPTQECLKVSAPLRAEMRSHHARGLLPRRNRHRSGRRHPLSIRRLFRPFIRLRHAIKVRVKGFPRLSGLPFGYRYHHRARRKPGSGAKRSQALWGIVGCFTGHPHTLRQVNVVPRGWRAGASCAVFSQSLTYRSRGTRRVGAFQGYGFHHGQRVALASGWARPLTQTLGLSEKSSRFSMCGYTRRPAHE